MCSSSSRGGTFLVTHLSEDGSVATTQVFRDIESLRKWAAAQSAPAPPAPKLLSVEPPAAAPDAADAAPSVLLRAVYSGEPLYAVDDTIDSPQRQHMLCPEDRDLLREFQTSFLETVVSSSENTTADDAVLIQAVYAASIRLWMRGGRAEIPTQYADLFQTYTAACLEYAASIPPRGVSLRPEATPDLQTLLRAHPLGPPSSNSEFAFYDSTACRQAWERIAVAIYCDVYSKTIREQTLCDWMTWLLQTQPQDAQCDRVDRALALLEADIARLPPSLSEPLTTAVQYATFRAGVSIQKVPVAVSQLRAANFEDHIGALLSTTA